ncbi:MAG: hypothetical protein ABSD31_04155 [Candidatus Binataceae bacterium]|jgi:hypothetical protein
MSRVGLSRGYKLHLLIALAAVPMAVLMASGAWAQGADSAASKNPASANDSVTPASNTASTIAKLAPDNPAPDAATKSFKADTIEKKFAAAHRAAMLKFERARATFDGFCKDWERKLSQRERDNFAAIQWKQEKGWTVGQYLGYSKIRSCTCKQSSRGEPIGELTYGETNNYLTGKTEDEAKHAKPKVSLSTETTEIFGWGKKGWEY